MVRGIIVFVVLSVVIPSAAFAQSCTLYFDGAVIEEEVPAPKGIIQVRLPAAMQPGSLRVKPFPGAVVDRVEVVPAVRKNAGEKEEARLVERKEQLSDRLKALETREEIFKSAAKSQSGKAPRKTKANPEPLATIRQGTDYALSQLEEVYRLRRKAEKELKEVDRRLALLRQETGAGDSMAKIGVSGKRRGVYVTYIRTDLFWAPRYDFRLADSSAADVTLRPKVPAGLKGKVSVVAGRLADSSAGKTTGYDLGPRSFRLPVERVKYSTGAASTLSFSLTNAASSPLPAGEASCFWQGEFVGNVSFPGCGPGETKGVSTVTESSPRPAIP